MTFRDLGPWLVAPVALLAATAPRTTTTISDAVRTGTEIASRERRPTRERRLLRPKIHTATPKQLDRYCDDARHLLWKFANANQPPPPQADDIHLAVNGTGRKGQVSLDEDVESSNHEECEERPTCDMLKKALQPFDLKFLIVTLPDPINSHLPEDFDGGLEAVQAAVAEAGYSIDRFYSPWEKAQEEQNPVAEKTGEGQDPEIQPGLILFRRYQSLLLVFVVGETPTAGINKLAFSSALEQIAGLASLLPGAREKCNRQDCTQCGRADCTTVNLLAPYFTGSAASLRSSIEAHLDWLSQWTANHPSHLKRPPPPRFGLVSGSASAVDQLEFYRAPFNKLFFDRPQSDRVDPAPFRAVVGYELEIRDAFLAFLTRELKVKPGEVALLRESDTRYGESLFDAKLSGPVRAPQVGGLIDYLYDTGARQLAQRLSQRVDLLFDLRKPLIELARLSAASRPSDVKAAAGNNAETAADTIAQQWSKDINSLTRGNFEALDLQFKFHPAFSRSRDEYEAAVAAVLAQSENPDWWDFGSDSSFVRLLDEFRKKPPTRGWLDLPFPLHISEIRGERQDQMAPQVLNLVQRQRTFFPVLTPAAKSKDLMPSFSPLDKASTALVMSNLLSTLSAQNIHYVGIVASDAQDTIYLAREVYAHCPNVTVFSFGSNLLFLNPDVAGDLRGMLVASTYPLFTLNQDWTYPWQGKHAYHQFSSESAEGLFNGTLALLGWYDKMLDYAPPFLLAGSRMSSDEPPVWITAVGKEGFVPIRILPQTKHSSINYLYRRPEPSKGFDPPKRWPLDPADSWASILAFGGATGACAWFALLALWPWTLRGRKNFWRGRLRGPSNRRFLALTAFLLNLLAFYLITSGLFALLRPAHLKLGIPESAIVTSRITLVLLFLSGLIYLLKSFRTMVWGGVVALVNLLAWLWMTVYGKAWRDWRVAWRGSAETLSAFVLVLIPVGSCVLVGAYLRWLSGADDHPYEHPALVFTAWRYLNPGNGESPLPPLFFASLAMVLWSASNVWRTAMLETIWRGPDAGGQTAQALQGSYLGMNSASLSDLPERQDRVRSFLSRSSTTRVSALAAVFLLAVFFLAAHTHASVEGSSFDRLLYFLLYAAYVAVTLNLVRIYAVWSEFRGLLKRLSWHPLREACAQLGELGKQSGGEGHAERSAGQVPEVSLGAAMPTFTALEFSIEQAQQLVTRGDELLTDTMVGWELADAVGTHRDELTDLLVHAKEHLATALSADAAGDFDRRRAEILTVEEDAAKMSSIVASILEPDWRLPATAAIPDNNREDRWRHAAGLFLASRILDYSRHILAQLRYLLGFTIVGLLLLLMSTSSYPFPNSDTLLRFSWTMLLGGAAVSVWILVQISRDRILSLLSGGTPGKIDWTFGFVGHLALYGLLPVLTVLGIQFPATLNGIIQSISSILPGGGAGH